MSRTTTSSASCTSTFVAWGRLLRLSLAPTAAADIVAGTYCAATHESFFAIPWIAVLASLCVYHGGMALNDWADRNEDARTRPQRPIPSGAIRASDARAIAILLLCLGPMLLLAYGSHAWITLAVVAILAAVYNLGGRGPWLGPLLLAACRGGNLAIGMQQAPLGELDAMRIAVIAAYAAYVFFVSRLGRLEDAPGERAGRAPSLYISAAASMLLVPGLATMLLQDATHWGFHVDYYFEPPNRWPALCLGAAGALFLICRRALPVREWTRAEVLPAMGTCLRFLLMFSATVAVAGGFPIRYIVGAGILLVGYPLAWGLRQVFPPS